MASDGHMRVLRGVWADAFGYGRELQVAGILNVGFSLQISNSQRPFNPLVASSEPALPNTEFAVSDETATSNRICFFCLRVSSAIS